MDDDEVTRRVAPEDQATPGAAEDPEKTELVANGGAYPAAPAAPAARPPSAGEGQPWQIANQGQQPPQPAANPGRPVAPPPQASASGPPPWGPAPSGPRPQYGPPPSPPPSGAPGPGYGAPPPGFGPGGPGPVPGPHQQYTPGAPNPYSSAPGFYPPPAPGGPPTADASSLIAKGGSFITTLMHRGIRGELIRQPGFQNMRQQSPDQMVYISYGIGLLFALLLSLLPSFVGILLADVVWGGLAYLLFAIGSKKAHQFIAYGIGLVGAVLALLSVLFSIAAFVDLASLNLAGAALTLVLGIVITLVSGVALAYLGFQVHREVKRLSTSG